MTTISVKNWERFQHYKDRNPLWIKLYGDMLTTESWVLGTDLSRLVQVASILLAGRYSNLIPHRFDLIKKVASLDCTEAQFNKAITHLIDTNFLEIQGLPKEEKPLAQDASTALASCPSEERREEIEERRGYPDMSSSKQLDPCVEVFDHWRSTWNHPRAALDPKRTAMIRRALRAYNAETLCESISGYRNSPHHTGQNDRNTVFDDIGLFLRDASHIDAGLRFARDPPTLTSPTTQHNVTVLQNWQPPEARDEDSRYDEISSGDGEHGRRVHPARLAADH